MIKGEKVYLRAILNNDIQVLNKWKNDENVFKFLGGGFMPTSINHQEKWMQSMIDTSGNNKRFLICDYAHNPIGMTGLYGINWIHRTCEVGIYIGEEQSQGRGYGKEAYTLIENFAKDYLNIRKLKLYVVNDNEAATGFWYSLEYQKVGELKEERFIKGKYMDLLLMEKFI